MSSTIDSETAASVRSALEVRPRTGLAAELRHPLLGNGPVRVADLEDIAELGTLADRQLVTFAAGSGFDCLAELRPMAPGFRLCALPTGTLVLSRFAHIRMDSGSLVLETPLGVGSMRLLHPAALTALAALAQGSAGTELIDEGEHPSEMLAFLELLVSGGFAGPPGEGGAAEVDETPALEQWEFHDLVFHSRSRLGRHDGEIGATFRFADRIEPAPCIAERSFPTTLHFTPPSGPLPLDSDLVSLLGRRASVRDQAQLPITIRELGDFLYHSARVSDFVPGPHGGFTTRPYPNGGASYELEVYVIADRCVGLEAGFYYYDAVEHGLAWRQAPSADTAALLDHAYIASGQTCRPQVLLAIASRFQRVSWKYAGIAYATTLKNVGVLYTTMYLVATAMGLAPCALGAGDSERFSRLAGTDRFTESTVGEFMLGSAS